MAALTSIFSTGSTLANSEITEKLNTLFEARYADSTNAPGGAILIAHGDSIIYERYFGIADMASREPIGPNTLFNIASVSKQFTVAGLLQQDINIQSTADKYFNFPQKFWSEITLADLAGHTSGLPDARDRSDRSKCIYATDESSEVYFPLVESLKFTPGTAYDYLNPSFILLARIIEQKSGMKFTDYQNEHIFKPLGMNSTQYFNPKGMPEHTAHSYIKEDNGEWVKYDYGEETFFATRPDGGIYSTARDMLKWESGLAGGKVIADSLRNLAYTPRISVSDSKWCSYQRRPHTWYGLGWFIETIPGAPVKVYHTGDNGAFQAYVAKYPELDLRIIVLENRNDNSRWQMARKLDEILLQHFGK